ncbi:MAG: efflux RND transporter permease subunit [Gemmatimonadales bacterium]
MKPVPPGTEGVRYYFIRRPVMAIVISIVITLLGAFAMLRLPVNRYPQITPPSIQVTAVYPGATAEDVAQAVAAPIEQQLGGLDGLLYYRSSNSSAGVMSLSVFFDISRDQDLAAVEVQNAVKLAEPQLPEEVRRNGIVIQKANTDILLVASLISDDPRYDAVYLTNYAKLYLEDELKRLPGVGNAQVFGELEFAMLLSLDPDKMAQLGITVTDVVAAVREQNATNPAGRIGREPAPAGTQLTLPVTTSGRLTDAGQYGDIIVRARPDGSLVRVRDIAAVRLGSRSYESVGRLNGRPTTFMLLYAQPGANYLQVKEAFVARMHELEKAFPQGVGWVIPFDTTPFIEASMEEVVKTLVEAMLLVTLVVFVFLQSWRATVIPLLAVPVSIIGTFLGLQALGFTINTLTLFGLVLAIGIVVDDAIVVIENAERVMAQEHLSPRLAADRAILQVRGALIAIVLVLCSVFIPVAFIPGITGAMYKEFAVTIVIAVVISGIVALTLTPALCALLLRHAPEQSENRFFRRFNAWFERRRNGYAGRAGRIIASPRPWLAVFLLIVAAVAVLNQRVPGGFIPDEDKGFFVVGIQLPDAASRQRTEEVVAQVERIILADSSVKQTATLLGLDLLTFSQQTNSATMFVGLKPWGERKRRDQSLAAIVGRVNGALWGLKEAISFAFNFPEIPGLGTTSGLEMNLQARLGGDIRQFAATVQQFVAEVNQLPVMQGAVSLIRADVPQIYVNVDREAAHARGVGPQQIFGTLQAMLSTLYINDFNLYGRTYRVQAEAQASFRQKPEDIGRFHVRNRDGAMIPLSALTTIEMRGGPSIVSRFNGFTSALVTGTPKPGRSSGEMLDAVEELIASKYSTQGIGFGYSGQSYQERAAEGGAIIVVVLGLVMVFLVLAAQYESFSIPFAVLLGIPFGVLGALFGAWIRGMPNDVYFQVGIIAVMGLAAKNAILIVEFANQLRDEGKSIADAAIEAARERFRPILMTSFAFIFGVAPLVIASGAGAMSRHSIGTGVFFGMLTATLIGIFFIPLFFSVIRGVAERGLFRRGRQAPVPVPAAPEKP